jgi:hypothetical protein
MPEDLLALIMKTYGIAGLLIVAPIIAVVFLWKNNNALQSQVVAQAALVAAAEKARGDDQSKRVADTERMAEKLLLVVKEQTALGSESNSLLERLVSSVDKLERHALTNGKGRS